MSTCARIFNIPGPRGAAGADGTNGSNGVNAFTITTDGFTMPAVGDTVVVEVEDTSWIVVSQDVGGAGEVDGQVIVVEFAGSFLATSIVDSTHVELHNLGYTNNAPPTTAIPSGAAVGPGGLQGDAGAIPGGALLAINNLSDVDNIATAQSNLGLAALAYLATVADAQFTGQLTVAKGGTGAANAAAARTNLGLVIGTDVQAFHALLAALSALAPTAADQLVFSNGVNTLGLTSLTAFARTILDDANAAAVRTTIGAAAITAIVTKIASYTATITDGVILCDATAGNITIDLPSAATATSVRLTVKKIDASANTVTLDGNLGELIDGAATQVISAQWTAIEIICDGSAWYVV